ncbi:unnamed protein product [Schistosoma curassoni]|uniref:ARF7EP_C domain-containing protein n=1 Tax=Schistosoma curassoni TaxID=6186 RepID=A0A183JP91_9TREM|nr:unnamed protein product [Schistosoma curassoni]
MHFLSLVRNIFPGLFVNFLFSSTVNSRLHPLYDSRGRLLGTLEYSCDCLKSECPGCHLPCRRCHSTFCGASYRITKNIPIPYRNLYSKGELQELVFDY